MCILCVHNTEVKVDLYVKSFVSHFLCQNFEECVCVKNENHACEQFLFRNRKFMYFFQNDHILLVWGIFSKLQAMDPKNRWSKQFCDLPKNVVFWRNRTTHQIEGIFKAPLTCRKTPIFLIWFFVGTYLCVF